MADYAAPAGNAVTFDADGLPYAAPDGDALVFDWISAWLDVAATFDLDLSFSASAALVATVSAEIDLDFGLDAAAVLVWPVSAELTAPLDFAADAGTAYTVSGLFALDLDHTGEAAESWYVPEPFVGITRLPWSPQQRIDIEIAAPHTQAATKTPSLSAPWAESEPIAAAISGDWRQVPAMHRAEAVPWADVVGRPGTESGIGYSHPPEKPRAAAIAWTENEALERRADLPWTHPPEKHRSEDIAWTENEALERRADLPWTHPPEKHRHAAIAWGPHWYPRWCIHQYTAPRGDQLIFDFSADAYLAPLGDQIVFDYATAADPLICFDGTWNGPKDPYWYRPHEWIIPPPTLRSYYIIMNTVILRRVSDNVEIPIVSMEISTDHDAWCWSLRAGLRREIDLDMVRPSSGAPVEVEAEINGYLWRFVVEEYGHDRAFGQRGYSIAGRSLAAYLAAPYSASANVLQTATSTAAQLADEALLYTGFTAELSIDDWLVTGGAYSLQNATPMQQLLTIAEAAGGVVHSDPRDTIVRLVPWYPSLPWQWGAVTVDAALPTWQERRTSYQASTQYSGVYVSGQAKGVTCLVKRTGTDGSRQPQMQTNALITATEPGLALGKKILADSGPRSIESIGAPLLPSPGLLTPGMIIEVADPSGNWRGMVIRTSLSAQRPTVKQSVDVLRYHGS